MIQERDHFISRGQDGVNAGGVKIDVEILTALLNEIMCDIMTGEGESMSIL